jgi:hypothetical protein
MTTRIVSRLKRLEARLESKPPCVLRYGRLKSLPDDFVGERHVVIVKRESGATPDIEICEFEERPGPAPPGSHDGVPRMYLSEADMKL